MRLIACIEEPDVAKKTLEHLGLRAEPLPTLRAQAPPVALELFFLFFPTKVRPR